MSTIDYDPQGEDDPATIKTFACLLLLAVTVLGAWVVWG